MFIPKNLFSPTHTNTTIHCPLASISSYITEVRSWKVRWLSLILPSSGSLSFRRIHYEHVPCDCALWESMTAQLFSSLSIHLIWEKIFSWKAQQFCLPNCCQQPTCTSTYLKKGEIDKVLCSSVPDPWHSWVDPDPGIHASD
jgi:hypothetical protein